MSNAKKPVNSSTPNNTQFQKRDRGAAKKRRKLNRNQKAALAVAVKKVIERKPTFTYVCTSCSKPVFKKAVHTAKDGEDKNSTHGLGKWKCVCGNKKVNRVKFQAPTEEKAAA